MLTPPGSSFRPHGRPTEHPGDLGRRHRDHQPELLQRRPDGLPHAEHRPHRGRGDALHRLIRRAELHRRPRVVHHRPERLPDRPQQGRDAGRRRGAAGRGRHDRGAAQAAGLRDRAVRQEPPRRPQQVPAHRPRLRRVLRQPLPPQRRGGAGDGQLAAGGGLPRLQRALPAARRLALLGHRGRRRHRGPALRARRPPADRGHRTADQEADGDHRRRGARPRARLLRPPGRRGHAVLLLVQHDAHAPAHAPEAGEHRAGGPLAVDLPRHDDRPRPGRRRSAGQARRARDRRQHDRRSTAPTTGRT